MTLKAIRSPVLTSEPLIKSPFSLKCPKHPETQGIAKRQYDTDNEPSGPVNHYHQENLPVMPQILFHLATDPMGHRIQLIMTAAAKKILGDAALIQVVPKWQRIKQKRCLWFLS